jgi:hypothetical protein
LAARAFYKRREMEWVTVVLHVGVGRPMACRYGGDAAHAGCERLPFPSAADEWGTDWFETVPGRGCPMGCTAHTVQPAKICFPIFQTAVRL